MRNVVKELSDLNKCISKYISNGNDISKIFNLTQIHIIGYLLQHEGEEVCQKDLEIETNLKKASITGCIDSLVDKNIVYRKQSETDRRKNYIYLTDMALKHKKDFEDRGNLLNNKIIENISEKDLKIFYNVLDSIRNNIKEISK